MRLRLTLAAAGLLVATSSCVSAPHLGDGSLFAGADPHAVAFDGAVWLYPTGGGSNNRQFVAWSSGDLAHWQKHGPILSLDDVPWIDDDHARKHYAWAPAVARANGRYYLYYSVGPQNPTPSRIGVAVADRPAGPFRDSGHPLVTGGAGFEAIDPMLFVDPKDGMRYLLAGGSAGGTLRAWVMKPDMVTIDREVPMPQPPLFTEGAFLHERGGTYYLSYSHGRYDRADYSVHYATGPSPLGPWTYRGALLQSTAAIKGPGHHGFFTDPATGRFMIAYHRWERAGSEPFRGQRRIAIAPVTYRADGSIAPVAMTGERTDPRDRPARRQERAGNLPAGRHGHKRLAMSGSKTPARIKGRSLRLAKPE